jgi:hypothetical protein
MSLVSCTQQESNNTPIDLPNTESLNEFRFNNLKKISAVNKEINRRDTINLILLQSDKCNVCNNKKLSKINKSLELDSAKIVVVVGNSEDKWSEVTSYLPNAKKIIKLNTSAIEKYGLSLMENYVIKFVNGQVKNYVILD